MIALPRVGHRDFGMWCSQGAFESTNYQNYQNMPVGAVTNTDEPGTPTAPYPYYFNLWVAGKNFAICAWNARTKQVFQAVGDPFVTK